MFSRICIPMGITVSATEQDANGTVIQFTFANGQLVSGEGNTTQGDHFTLQYTNGILTSETDVNQSLGTTFTYHFSNGYASGTGTDRSGNTYYLSLTRGKVTGGFVTDPNGIINRGIDILYAGDSNPSGAVTNVRVRPNSSLLADAGDFVVDQVEGAVKDAVEDAVEEVVEDLLVLVFS